MAVTTPPPPLMGTPLRALIVEDSERDAVLVVSALEHAGYDVAWRRVETADAMREALATDWWDVIISDYRLPQFNAPAALSLLKETGLDPPFIIVSGTIGEEAAVASLRAGARDFFNKDRLTCLAAAVEREVREAAARRSGREAADAHERQEARFRALIENASDITNILDATGVVLYESPSCTRILGYPQGANVGRRLLEFVHPDDADRAQQAFEEILANPQHCPILELRIRHADGSWRWLEATGSNQLDHPAIRGLVVNSRDVTERAIAESELRESEERYRSLFSNMLEGYAYCRMAWEDGRPADWVYLDVNRAFEELTGLKDVVGRRVSEIIPGLRQANPDLFEFYGRVAATGRPERLETYLEPLGIWFSVSAFSPVRGCFVAVFDNITNRKRAETEARRAIEALRQSETHFRSLIERASDLIVTLDPAGVIRYASPSFQRALGYDPGALIGVAACSMIHPDDVARALETLAAAVADPDSHHRLEYRHHHQDGSWRYLEGTATNLLANPDVAGIVINSRDVTDRVRLQERYVQSQKMEAIGQLAGGVAHDFNNLLTVMRANTEFLLEELATEDTRRADVLEIRTAVDRAAMLTRQLLAFSRRQRLKPIVVDVNVVLADLATMLRRLIGEDIELVVEPCPCQATALVDRGQLEQVVINLCVNGRDAMPEGGRLTLTTVCRMLDQESADRYPGLPPGAYVELAVQDNGLGMAPDVVARVFEPFFTTKAQGTGLGLATVFGILQQSRGTVTVVSEPGRGATFRVLLPQVEAPAAGSADGDATTEVLRGTEHVLLVEDEPPVRAAAARALRRAGFTILEAADGEEAQRRFAEASEPIDILVTDAIMPKIGGRDLAERLTALRPGLKVLFVSGYTSDPSHRGIPAGANLLEKPFTPEALVRAVREVLDASAAGAAASPPGPVPR